MKLTWEIIKLGAVCLIAYAVVVMITGCASKEPMTAFERENIEADRRAQVRYFTDVCYARGGVVFLDRDGHSPIIRRDIPSNVRDLRCVTKSSIR